MPVNPIKTIKEAVEDEQLNFRGMIPEIRHHESTIRMYGQPIKMSETPAEMRLGAPMVGEHNIELFKEWFDMEPEQVAELKEKGII